MNTYIIRIYRQDDKERSLMTGVMETPDESKAWNFHSAHELIGILTNKKTKPQHGGHEKRRTERLKLKIPVMVRGINSAGRKVSEDTFTEDFSSNGALFVLKNLLVRDAEVHMLIDPPRSCLYKAAQIARVHGNNKGHCYGVYFV